MFYTENGVKKNKPQGKIFQVNGEWFFLANVDAQKFIRKYKGYAIAQRVLEAFDSQGLKRVTILYKNTDNHVTYITNSKYMKSAGIYDNLHSHRQVILPIDHWSPVTGYRVGDPKGLPIVDVNLWSKGIQEVYEYVDNTAYIRRAEPPKQMGLAI